MGIPVRNPPRAEQYRDGPRRFGFPEELFRIQNAATAMLFYTRYGHSRQLCSLQPLAIKGQLYSRIKVNNMNVEQIEKKKDYFWVYVGLATVALVGVIAMVKLSENEKYDPIRQQMAEEAAQMNIRVLN
ncbi:hypothetical protein [Methylocaldum szegediense]|nr:hypothetical protein [Methylocaldum szegediense]